MKIEMLDVVQLRDGREGTVLEIAEDAFLLELTVGDDVIDWFPRDDVSRVVWHAKAHS